MERDLKAVSKKPIVSFDFDGSLKESKELQDLARLLVEEGYEVHITTRRSDDNKRSTEEYMEQYPPYEVHELAASLGIKNVNFTHGEYKYRFFKGKSGWKHIDDDPVDVDLINTDHMNYCEAFLITDIESFKTSIYEFDA